MPRDREPSVLSDSVTSELTKARKASAVAGSGRNDPSRAGGGANNPDGSEPGTPDRIKFEISQPELDTSSNKEAAKTEIVDETIRLFQSMPKGLEYFITTGPPKQVNDFSDYEKLSEAHERLKIELKVQREPRRERLATLAEKKIHFVNAIKMFNHFLADMERKEKRARMQYKKHRKEREMMSAEIPGLQEKLAELKAAKNEKLRRFGKYTALAAFVENTIKNPDVNFKSFYDLRDRYVALCCTYEGQVAKYMNDIESLEKTKEYYENYVIESKENILRMRTVLMEKKMELDRMLSLNSYLGQVVRYRQEQQIRRDADFWRMTGGVVNMVNTLMEYRPFTIGRLKNKLDVNSQIEAIGHIITDYDRILRRLSEQQAATESTRKVSFESAVHSDNYKK